MLKSLSVKINIIIVLIIVLLMSVYMAYDYKQTHKEHRLQLEEKKAGLSERLPTSLANDLWNLDLPGLTQILNSEMLSREVYAISVTDKLSKKIVTAIKRNDAWEPEISKTEPKSDIVTEFVRRDIRKGMETIGWVDIFITNKFNKEAEKEWLKLIIFRGLLIILLGSIALTCVIQYMVSRPLKKMIFAFGSIVEGNYSVELPTRRSDELGTVHRSFASMRDSVKDTIDKLNQEILIRTKAENESRNARVLLSHVLMAMPSVIIVVDNDAEIIQWNNMAEAKFHMKAKEAIGKKLNDLNEKISCHHQFIQSAIIQRTVLNEEAVQESIDGHVEYHDITVYPLSIDEEQLGAVLRIDDVTERFRLKEMMVQTEKMMSVGGLAAGMAHEINNPLGGIMQGAQNILRRLSPKLTKNHSVAEELGTDLDTINQYLESRDIIKFVSGIRNSGERAAKIVKNMLQFSRKSEAAKSYASINDLLDQSLMLASNDYDLKKQIDFKRIDIITTFAPDVPEIACSYTELEQVFLNILKNAAHAMSEIEDSDYMPKLTIETSLTNDEIIIEISDNGPGMPETVKQRIFEPFFTTKPVGIGTGLGLSVSYMIITQNHCGKMSVESVKGKGTTFMMALPVR